MGQVMNARTESRVFADVLERELLRWVQRLRTLHPERFGATHDGAACSACDCARRFLEGVRLLQHLLDGRPAKAVPARAAMPHGALDACASALAQAPGAYSALTQREWRELVLVPGIDMEIGKARRRGELAWLILKRLVLLGKRFDELGDIAAGRNPSAQGRDLLPIS